MLQFLCIETKKTLKYYLLQGLYINNFSNYILEAKINALYKLTIFPEVVI